MTTPLHFRHILFAVTMAAVMLTACGESSTYKPNTHVKDKKAYALGEEHARQLILIADDEAAVQDKLLDIRARISNIQSHLGSQSANDYEAGFTDYLHLNSDSLARIIF